MLFLNKKYWACYLLQILINWSLKLNETTQTVKMVFITIYMYHPLIIKILPKLVLNHFRQCSFPLLPENAIKPLIFLLFSKGYRKETLNWNGLLYLKIGIRIFLVSHSSSVKPSSLLSSTLESLSSSFSLSQTLHWRISVCTNSYLKHSYFRLQIRLQEHDINSRTYTINELVFLWNFLYVFTDSTFSSKKKLQKSKNFLTTPLQNNFFQFTSSFTKIYDSMYIHSVVRVFELSKI